MTRFKYAAVAGVLLVTLLTAVILAVFHPYESTIRSRLDAAGAGNVIEEADELFERYPVDAGKDHWLSSGQWPPGITRLKPLTLHVTEDGVYIRCDKLFVEEQGIFVLRDGSTFVPEPWSDPAFEEIEARIYYYEVKG